MRAVRSRIADALDQRERALVEERAQPDERRMQAAALVERQELARSDARRGARERFDLVLGKGADDEGMHPALEIARDVFDRLARPGGKLGRHVERLAAKLADRDLEGRSRAQRRLLEQEADMPACQRRRRRRPEPQASRRFDLG